MNAVNTRPLAIREQPLPEPVTSSAPHCAGDIKLTESLAAPFIRAREAAARSAAAKAHIAVIVSHALPKGVKQFELIDGVYVGCSSKHLQIGSLGTARALRSRKPFACRPERVYKSAIFYTRPPLSA